MVWSGRTELRARCSENSEPECQRIEQSSRIARSLVHLTRETSLQHASPQLPLLIVLDTERGQVKNTPAPRPWPGRPYHIFSTVQMLVVLV